MAGLIEVAVFPCETRDRQVVMPFVALFTLEEDVARAKDRRSIAQELITIRGIC